MNRLKEVLCSEHQILLCTYVVDELKDKDTESAQPH
jgi:hypothetical protein